MRRAGLSARDRTARSIDADWVRGGDYQVNVGGARYPITVSLRPLYDPAGERIRT